MHCTHCDATIVLLHCNCVCKPCLYDIVKKTYCTYQLPHIFILQIFTDREEIQNKRRDILTRPCENKQNGNGSLPWLDRMFVDEKHKIIYCYIPKNACSTMKRVMKVLSGTTSGKDPLEINGQDIHYMKAATLKDYTPDEAREKLDTYFKFLVVRDPIKRLWSGYLDKVYLGEFSHFSRLAIRKFRKNASEEDSQCGLDATFGEFLRLTADQPGLDEHWTPFVDLCKPCSVEYNAVVRLDTLYEDLVYILEKSGATQDIDLTRLRSHSSSSDDIVAKAIARTMNSDLKRIEDLVYEKDGERKNCSSGNELANRLWTSFIWRRYLPPNAPYPAILTGEQKVTSQQMSEIYNNVTKNLPYSTVSRRVPSYKDVIRDSFDSLAEFELASWLDVYKHDFIHSDYSVPEYFPSFT